MFSSIIQHTLFNRKPRCVYSAKNFVIDINIGFKGGKLSLYTPTNRWRLNYVYNGENFVAN